MEPCGAGSDAWVSFVNSSEEVTFPDENIEKIDAFIYDTEPIISMDEENDILVITTPQRIWFMNLSNNKTDTLTVWDGIPFFPIRSFKNPPEVNTTIYDTHDIAPIKFVLWDDTNSKYWIGTDFGLGSVDLSSLSL